MFTNDLLLELCDAAPQWGVREGWSFTSRWTRNGIETGSIGVRIEDGRAVLHYRNRTNQEAWQDVEYAVTMEWTPCNFGGKRAWFRCPASYCGRRVAVLYGGNIFACRRCHGLAYECQRERDYDRQLRRAQGIRMRLGGTGSMAEHFPEKPKRMHWRTYERLRAQ